MKFSTATFNLENLITAEKPIYHNTRPRYEKNQYQQKINWIKTQLLKMDAEIIGFQEVFEEQALRDCLIDTPYEQWNLVMNRPENGKPANALLSKFPIISTQTIEEIPFEFSFFDDKKKTAQQDAIHIAIPIKKFSRALLKAEIQVTATTSILLYVIHLKSKRPILPDGLDRDLASYTDLAQGNIRSLIRRGIECAGIRALISRDIETTPTKPLILVGDLNDTDTSVTNQIILGEAPFHRLPEDIKKKKWEYVLQNCKDIQARKSIENFYFTYIHNGHYESLDNIFVSNHFAELNQNRIGRVIDVRLYNDHVIDDTVSLDKKPIFVTDHGQVVANFKLFT
ncbi:MAG: endonuclease/exonuclease/phosphatase family protein [Candidatus Dependentiae bacterium]|nr:endonuclease/exonuclease/phosphatase family protein [Candidatus Dependentiae bacterium]